MELKVRVQAVTECHPEKRDKSKSPCVRIDFIIFNDEKMQKSEKVLGRPTVTQFYGVEVFERMKENLAGWYEKEVVAEIKPIPNAFDPLKNDNKIVKLFLKNGSVNLV